MATTQHPTPVETPDRSSSPNGRRRRPDRAQPPGGGGGRRLQPAGYAFLILLGAALIGSLLNAQGLRKTAINMDPGAGRDLALALTKPLVEVSAFLRLDRPREEILEAIGRGGQDEVDVEIVLPPVAVETQPGEAPAGRGETSPGAETAGGEQAGEAQPGKGETAPPAEQEPEKPAFTPSRKMKVWIAGDSLAITPGLSIAELLGATKVVRTVAPVDGRVSTGLERPDVFNWFTHVPEQIRKYDPDVVILTFGANDDHGYMTGLPEGVEVDDFATKAWVKEYRRRVGGLMDIATRGGRTVVWIGVPITRSPDQSRRYRVLNTIYQTEAEKRDRVIFINTYRMFQDENGDYADYLPNAKGELIDVRASDGVHFERAGGDLIAREVLRRLKEVYDLTSWKKKRNAGRDADTPRA